MSRLAGRRIEIARTLAAEGAQPPLLDRLADRGRVDVTGGMITH